MLQGGRRKAYRPLPEQARAAALQTALHAYDAGDFFETHELLEPAWMGTADELERELYQGLIKLAAAGVHMVRGNPTGMANNLRGARLRLARVVDGAGLDAGLDLPALVDAIDARLAIVATLPPAPARTPGSPRFAFRPALTGIDMPELVRRRA